MTTKKKEQPLENDKKKSCFVMMPISDMEGYDKGHFKRVYEYLIKPACLDSGYEPIRADDVSSSNFIVIDILKRIVESELVICDMSGRNPNVLYELGVRQAFNLPTVLLKDNTTDAIFDISGLRHVEYDFSLRVDVAKDSIAKIRSMIMETVNGQGDEINSLIQLLGIKAASLPTGKELSAETGMILSAIDGLASRVRRIEGQNAPLNSTEKLIQLRRALKNKADGKEIIVNGIKTKIGEEMYLAGECIGQLVSIEDGVITIENSGEKRNFYPFDKEFSNISPIPF
ncbi:hypothetical protein [Alteromonas gracilis]|uniref:hypothetical protein n=1 Tax=Alteromonas gracilis TaxID=1479524 RepID=UPI003735F5BF